jgi:DNA-binding beta-propeller fold protein YncE
MVAGCGGHSHGRSTGTHNARIAGRPPRRGFPGGAARRGCSTAVGRAPALATTRTVFVHLTAPPFGVAATSDGRWSFVDEIGSGIAVFSDAGFTPRLLRTVSVPEEAVGNSLTRDGRYLLIADGRDGASVISAARAETGAAHAVLGVLAQPGHGGDGGGAIEVTSSPDSHYVFVSIEGGDRVAVYNLRAALADGFHKSSYLGSVPLGQLVVGMAVSPDGRWLYATSELAAGARPSGFEGSLSVISLAKAERDPARAVIANIPAQCSPVRVVLSPDGGTVWVTARESDQLLAFSAAKLRSDPTHALLAEVRVGESPVGLALIDGGRRVVVADSNRFAAAGAHAGLTVVDAQAALAHRPALLGTIPAGSFPREMALEPDGETLLVGNFGSDQLEAVAVGQLR